MIPMLEFSKLPPRNEDRLKRRRKRPIKTPKFPKVRSVAVSGPQVEPRHSSRESLENDDLETIVRGAKWVSPQFSDSCGTDAAKKGKRQLLFNGQNLDPPPRHGQRKGALSLKNRKKKPTQIFLETTCAGADGGCARARAWRHGHVTSSQNVSLYPSGPPSPAPVQLRGYTPEHLHARTSPSPEQLHNGHTSPAPEHLHRHTSPAPEYLPAPSLSTSHHFPSPDTGQTSQAFTPSRRSDKVCHSDISDAGESGEDPVAAVTSSTCPVMPLSSDDSTYLEDMDKTCAPSNSSKIMESKNNCGQKRKTVTHENSVSSSTESPQHSPVDQSLHHTFHQNVITEQLSSPSPMEMTSHLPDSCSHNLFDVCPQKTDACLSSRETELRDRTSSQHGVACGLNLRSGANKRQCLVRTAHQTTGCSSSDNLSDLVASMSMDEGQKTDDTNDSRQVSRTTPRQVSRATPKPPEAAQCPDSYFTTPPSFNNCSQQAHIIAQSLIAHNPKSIEKTTNGDSMIVSNETLTMCNMKQFKPSSFSTPVQSTGMSAAVASIGLYDDKTRANHSCGDGSTCDRIMNDSLTRLEEQWPNAHETNPDTAGTTTTPSRGMSAILPASPPKSILKKRSRITLDAWDERNAAKGNSKCVTFNLPGDCNLSDGEDSVLAKETPVELWRTVNSSSYERQRNGDKSLGDEGFSVLARETPLELWHTLNTSSNQSLNVPLVNEGYSELASETPINQWQTVSSADERLVVEDVTSDGCCCVLASETPIEQWHTLNFPSSEIRVRQNVNTVKENRSMLTSETPSGIWRSLNASGHGQMGKDDLTYTEDGFSVLARETPSEFWQTLSSTSYHNAPCKALTALSGGNHSELAIESPMQTSHSVSTNHEQDKEAGPNNEECSVLTIASLTQVINPVCGEENAWTEDLRGSGGDSSVLAAETPKDQWCSLNIDHCRDKNFSGYVCCTASSCDSHKEVVGNSDTHTNFENNVWITQQSSNPTCIFAMETPVHMWTSPTVKLVDNTFKHF